MKTWLLAILVFVGLVIGGLLVKMAFFPVVIVDQSINMAQGIDVKVLDANNAVMNYEWFKTQEESIEALYNKEIRAKKAVEDFKGLLLPDRNNWTREDKTEYDRLSSIVVGLGNQIDDAIALYNARSKMVNRSIFKDNLPTNLNRAFFAALNLTK